MTAKFEQLEELAKIKYSRIDRRAASAARDSSNAKEDIKMRYEENGKVIALEREEMVMLLRHLRQFECLVKEFELREEQGRLSDAWNEQWAVLKQFLVSEELEGSQTPQALAVDGRYCCQWRTRGLSSGEKECHQYDAWYVFAWSACVAAAIARNSDATLVAGECSDVRGCP